MKSLAQVCVLSADFGLRRREFRINERAKQCDDAAQHPRAENEYGRVNLLRDDIRIDEDARTDDAAHYNHRRIKQS